jgi:hypothetical protein
LERIEEMSEFFSSDQQVTIGHVIAKLLNMEGYLKAQINKPGTFDTKEFCRSLISRLNKRFPDCGTKKKLYAFGAILHPFYRGLTLSRHDPVNYREMVELLIKENEEEVAGPTNVLGDDVDDDEEEDFSVEAQIR